MAPKLEESSWQELPDGPGEARGAAPGPSASLVFAAFTLVVQALMSYDGGATQLSTHNLRVYGGWQASELGLLMAMDRIGVVLTGSLWSAALTHCEAKPLLVLGVISKAISCFLFGVLEFKWSMLITKFFMGLWEGLFAIWATTWVGQRAPRDSKEVWQNYLGIFAALGNGVGGLVAGLLSERYALAFVCQALLLGLAWALLLLLPAESLELESCRARSSAETPSTPPAIRSMPSLLEIGSCVYPPNSLLSYWKAPRQHTRKATESVRKGIRWFWAESCGLVLGTPLWLHTAMSFSLCFFVTTGVSCLWQNTVVNVWGFTDWQATLSYQATTVTGGLPGVLLGPRWINGRLDREQPQGQAADRRRRCLALCRRATLAAAVCGSLGASFLAAKIGFLVHYNMPQEAWDVVLLALILSIVLLLFFVNAVQGFFIEINRTSVEARKQSFAIGLTLNCQNLFGFALGALLPGVATSAFGDWLAYTWPGERYGVVDAAEFTFGMCFVLAMPWALCLFTCCAHEAAARG